MKKKRKTSVPKRNKNIGSLSKFGAYPLSIKGKVTSSPFSVMVIEKYSNNISFRAIS